MLAQGSTVRLRSVVPFGRGWQKSAQHSSKPVGILFLCVLGRSAADESCLLQKKKQQKKPTLSNVFEQLSEADAKCGLKVLRLADVHSS